MIPHALKLVWNRKRMNALIVLEILISFIVVFAVVAGISIFTINYGRPLGFDYQNVVTLDVELPSGSQEESGDRMQALIRAAKHFEGVESAAAVQFQPYFPGRNVGRWDINGKLIDFDRNFATEDYADVMRIPVVEGRWFGREDDGAGWVPVVIDRDFATALYGNTSPIGQEFDPGMNPPQRVIGVVGDYRATGEFASRNNYVFFPANLGLDATRIVARVSPGVYSGEFEERFVRHLERIVPGASVTGKLLSQERSVALRVWFVPLFTSALIASFLLVMVALGMTGILWQNVTQRTKELGLRRAVGADRKRVSRQILAEISFIVTLGLILGVAIIAQVPLMRIFTFLEPVAFGIAIAASLTVMYGLAIACGLYPSWLAARIEPAEALHYE